MWATSTSCATREFEKTRTASAQPTETHPACVVGPYFVLSVETHDHLCPAGKGDIAIIAKQAVLRCFSDNNTADCNNQRCCCCRLAACCPMPPVGACCLLALALASCFMPRLSRTNDWEVEAFTVHQIVTRQMLDHSVYTR